MDSRRARSSGNSDPLARAHHAVHGGRLRELDRAAGGAGNEKHAERCFRDAIEITRRQKARFWELRATSSLVRLLARQGKREEARKMLTEIYNWFTEGFEFTDLKDAKTLLEEL